MKTAELRGDYSRAGPDYGVEQDFCLRAASAGFRHLLAADVYVRHQGETAFAPAEAQELSVRAERALDKLYPHYPAQRAEFLQRDPARPFQRRVDLLRLAASPRERVVLRAPAVLGGSPLSSDLAIPLETPERREERTGVDMQSPTADLL